MLKLVRVTGQKARGAFVQAVEHRSSVEEGGKANGTDCTIESGDATILFCIFLLSVLPIYAYKESLIVEYLRLYAGIYQGIFAYVTKLKPRF